MLDAFKAHDAILASAMEAFPAVDGQHGLLVVVNGQVAGLDWVSRSAACRQLHPNLLKSYVFDALIEPTTREVPVNEAKSQAEKYLQQIRSLAGRSFPSVGLGSDHRF